MNFSTGLRFCDALGLRFHDLIFRMITPAFDDHGFSVVQDTAQHGAGQDAVIVDDFCASVCMVGWW